MTYNFDADRWYEAHLAVLEGRRDRGDLDAQEFEAELADLDRRLEEMLDRLDGTYQIDQRKSD